MFESFLNWIVQCVFYLGYFGLALAMAIESTFIPLPSEIILIPAGYLWYIGKWNPIWIVVFAVIGTIIGSFFSYWLGEKLGRPFVEKHKKWFLLNDNRIKEIDAFFVKYGSASIFFARLVFGLRHFSSFFAGFAKTKKRLFAIYTVLGSAIWSIFLMLLGYFLGTQKQLIKMYMSYFSAVAISIVVLIILFFVFKKYWNKRKERLALKTKKDFNSKKK